MSFVWRILVETFIKATTFVISSATDNKRACLRGLMGGGEECNVQYCRNHYSIIIGMLYSFVLSLRKKNEEKVELPRSIKLTSCLSMKQDQKKIMMRGFLFHVVFFCFF